MTIRLSSGLRDAVITNYGLGAMLFGGHIQVYSGPQPDSADMAPSGALLALVTQDGSPAATTGGLKLTYGPKAGELINDGAWVLEGVASGTPGWWRFVGPHPDDGAHSAYFARLDGAVNDSVQDMPALIADMTVLPVGGFLLSLPSQ